MLAAKPATQLFAHQQAGIEFLERTPRAALFDEPGLGKSLQSLSAAVEPILIVAPAMVLQGGVWDDELAKWRPGVDAVQVPYSQLMRRDIEERNGRRVSIPSDKLRSDLRHRWGTVIFDEAHYLKGRKTKWTRAALEVSKFADRLYLLTGTPLPNWAHEAFTLLQLLHPEEAVPGGELGSYWRWVERFFVMGEQFGRGGVVVSHHAIQGKRPDVSWAEFHDQTFGDLALRRLRKDCLDLPPLTEQYMRLPMLPAQKKAYREMREQFITWLEDGEEVSALTIAAQLAKLARFATGVEVEQPGAKPCSNKLNALDDLLADRERPTLVLGHFKATVAAAAARIRAQGKQVAVITGDTSAGARSDAVRAFQEGRVPVLCATLSTIAEGLTFTNCDQVIFLERSYRPSINEQAVRRIHRIGQTQPVTAVHLVSRGTVDENVIELLKAKTDEQMQALSRMEMMSLVGID